MSLKENFLNVFINNCQTREGLFSEAMIYIYNEIKSDPRLDADMVNTYLVQSMFFSNDIDSLIDAIYSNFNTDNYGYYLHPKYINFLIELIENAKSYGIHSNTIYKLYINPISKLYTNPIYLSENENRYEVLKNGLKFLLEELEHTTINYIGSNISDNSELTLILIYYFSLMEAAKVILNETSILALYNKINTDLLDNDQTDYYINNTILFLGYMAKNPDMETRKEILMKLETFNLYTSTHKELLSKLFEIIGIDLYDFSKGGDVIYELYK